MLPAWRGAAPVQHAVLRGDDITGATTFQIVKELDAGPVFGTLTEPIRPADTSGDLLGRLAVSGAELLVRTLDGIEDGTVRAVPQPADGVSFAPEAHPGRRPGGLEAPRPPDRPPDPRLHPRPRRLDRVRTSRADTGRLKLWPVTLAAGAAGAGADAARAARPWPPGNCASTGTPSTLAPARSRSASATSSPRASAACPPPTGPAASRSANDAAASSTRLSFRLELT